MLSLAHPHYPRRVSQHTTCSARRVGLVGRRRSAGHCSESRSEVHSATRPNGCTHANRSAQLVVFGTRYSRHEFAQPVRWGGDKLWHERCVGMPVGLWGIGLGAQLASGIRDGRACGDVRCGVGGGGGGRRASCRATCPQPLPPPLEVMEGREGARAAHCGFLIGARSLTAQTGGRGLQGGKRGRRRHVMLGGKSRWGGRWQGWGQSEPSAWPDRC
jgi:hypothetical protein